MNLLNYFQANVKRSLYHLLVVVLVLTLEMSQDASAVRLYIKVPYNEKDEVKNLGAHWDIDKKLWYCNDTTSIDNINTISSKWSIILNTSYAEKDEVKGLGAKFDGELKKWLIPPGSNSLLAYSKWLPVFLQRQPSPKPTPKKAPAEKKKREKKEEKTIASTSTTIPQVNINVVLPNNKDTDKETNELKKIKTSIKDNCSFNVNELKELLKSRGIKGISALSKQELIDKCMELKLLNTVLVPAAPIETKKRKADKIESSSSSSAAATAAAAAVTPQVPPNDFECPILFEMMKDPVLAADGFSYERSAIEAWLRSHNTSPKTNEPLVHKNLIPNLTLKALINDWRHNNAH